MLTFFARVLTVGGLTSDGENDGRAEAVTSQELTLTEESPRPRHGSES